MKETAEDKKTIDLVIKIPTSAEPWRKGFDKTSKIQEVINAIVHEFGFATNGNYDLRLESNPTEPLRPERTLVSYQLKDDTVLIFSDLGIAV